MKYHIVQFSINYLTNRKANNNIKMSGSVDSNNDTAEEGMSRLIHADTQSTNSLNIQSNNASRDESARQSELPGNLTVESNFSLFNIGTSDNVSPQRQPRLMSFPATIRGGATRRAVPIRVNRPPLPHRIRRTPTRSIEGFTQEQLQLLPSPFVNALQQAATSGRREVRRNNQQGETTRRVYLPRRVNRPSLRHTSRSTRSIEGFSRSQLDELPSAFVNALQQAASGSRRSDTTSDRSDIENNLPGVETSRHVQQIISGRSAIRGPMMSRNVDSNSEAAEDGILRLRPADTQSTNSPNIQSNNSSRDQPEIARDAMTFD